MRRMKIAYSLTAAGLRKLVAISSTEDAPRQKPATAADAVKPADGEAVRHDGAASDTVENRKQLDAPQ